MNVPVVRMIGAAFRSETSGILRFLESMDPDEQDKRPECPRILLASDDDAAVGPTAEGAISTMDFPLVAVMSAVGAEVHVTGVVGRAFDVPSLHVSCPYITSKMTDRAQAWRDADYTFRAMCHSLNAGLLASNMGAARVRGKVTIIKHNSITYGPVFVQLQNGWIVGELAIDLHVRVLP